MKSSCLHGVLNSNTRTSPPPTNPSNETRGRCPSDLLVGGTVVSTYRTSVVPNFDCDYYDVKFSFNCLIEVAI